MKTQQTLLQLLSTAHPYALGDLPSSIRIPAVETCRPDEVVRPLEEATIDDVAFAILGVEAEVRVVHRRLNALRELYDLARKRGAWGADNVSDTFAHLRDEGGRK
jgi:hypothetical protein